MTEPNRATFTLWVFGIDTQDELERVTNLLNQIGYVVDVEVSREIETER